MDPGAAHPAAGGDGALGGRPEQARWQLPDSYLVQNALIEALRAAGVTLTSDLLPGQLPLPRRGR